MFLLQQVLTIHDEIITKYGGSFGVRDAGALQSALNRPFQFFADTELYPTPQAKAAAITQSIIINHPFIDGNKRTAYYLAKSLLIHYNFKITAIEDVIYNFIIEVAEGKLEIEDIEEWFYRHIEVMTKK